MAERCFRVWIQEIEGDAFEGSCRWWRLNEAGAFPDKPAFYVLLSGMRISKYPLILSWQEIAGDAELDYFWLHGDVITFLKDITRLGSKFEIAYDL